MKKRIELNILQFIAAETYFHFGDGDIGSLLKTWEINVDAVISVVSTSIHVTANMVQLTLTTMSTNYLRHILSCLRVQSLHIFFMILRKYL